MLGKEKILVVDDDPALLETINDILMVRNYPVDTATSGEEAIAKANSTSYDLVVTDIMMSGMSGLILLQELKKLDPNIIVIVISAHGKLEVAIEATKLGAYDFIPKPFSDDEILLRINRALEFRRGAIERDLLQKKVEDKYSLNNIISRNPAMRALFDQVNEIAQTDATVIILGETGTGKELFANAIHYYSHRKNMPFISLHCAALSETLLESELFGHEKGAFTGAFKQKKGKFEIADGGTLFLDEVGDIPLSTQVKLLRILQEKEFERVGGTDIIKANIRIIAATHKNLLKAIKESTFREDFYYRLNVFPLNIPPLRERINDIPLLVDHFIKESNKKFNKNIESVSENIMKKLMDYHWPGNIRELENIIERAVLSTKDNVINNIQLSQTTVIDKIEVLEEIEDYKEFCEKVIDPLEKRYFINTINIYKGEVETIIAKMGISRRTFYSRLKDFNIDLKKP
jgi:DNA-binding NtrC family response regulator